MHRGARILIVLVAAGALLAAAARWSSGAGQNKERHFFSARAGVGAEAPVGWTLSLHTGYGNVLCTFLHPGGSRISLAADRTAAKDAAALVAESRPGLAAQGIAFDHGSPAPRGGVMVDARLTRRNQAIRQYSLVRDVDAARGARQAEILTRSTPAGDLGAASAPFDWVIAHLELEAPVRPEAKPDAGR